MNIEYTRPWLYPKQTAAIFDGRDVKGDLARYAFIEASTKAGKTVGCLAWLLEQAVTRGGNGRNFWWVAPVYGQTKIAFRRMKTGLPKTIFTANETELWIELLDGTRIWFKSAEKPDNLYGEDVYAVVLDEASRMREEAYTAVRSTLTATRGPLRAIGNVKGRRNWFYRLARRAEAGDINMSFAKLTATDAVSGGVLEQAEIDDAERMLPEQVFRELYFAEASDDQGNPFGMKHIAACVGALSDRAAVANGVDLAKSVDWAVAIGLDDGAAVCGFERWQSPWDETEKKIIELCGKTPTLIDSTGVGDPIVERLQKVRRMYQGYHFTAQSKQRLMEGLAVKIQSHELTFPDGPIRSELDSFEYVYTRTGVKYSAPEGYHDDCVVSLALAVEMHRQVAPFLRSVRPLGGTRISPWLGGTDGPHPD
ncbi:Terminase-like family [uncultured Caudovirales phage]|uniref:Terminase-like family n=1 Tax=uncultured Caudovirales phage TaxID=2100421 RepID=A0A6J5QK69_9CAUD|nr:Terminase-like family [uncultured Caudovirales phage]